MKKIDRVIMVFVLFFMFTLTACGSNNSSSSNPNIQTSIHTHNWSLVSDSATCTQEGIKRFSCYCGQTKTETTKKTGHKYAETGDIICSVCGYQPDYYKTTTICDDETSITVSEHKYYTNWNTLNIDAEATVKFTITDNSEKLNFNVIAYSTGLTVFYLNICNSDGHQIGHVEISCASPVYKKYEKILELKEKIKKNKNYYYYISYRR